MFIAAFSVQRPPAMCLKTDLVRLDDQRTAEEKYTLEYIQRNKGGVEGTDVLKILALQGLA